MPALASCARFGLAPHGILRRSRRITVASGERDPQPLAVHCSPPLSRCFYDPFHLEGTNLRNLISHPVHILDIKYFR